LSRCIPSRCVIALLVEIGSHHFISLASSLPELLSSISSPQVHGTWFEVVCDTNFSILRLIAIIALTSFQPGLCLTISAGSFKFRPRRFELAEIADAFTGSIAVSIGQLQNGLSRLPAPRILILLHRATHIL
jgi:hypothetical protein